MTSGDKGMVVMCSGFVAFIIAAVVLFVSGHRYAAWVVGNVGSFVWVFSILFWVAIFDSKKRWPGEPFLQRLGSMLTYRRD